jgi:hypothetical protein
MTIRRSSTSILRVQRHRAELRRRGLRPVQFWVADTKAPGFDEECARQARLVRDAATPETDAEDAAWFDLSDKSGWTA